ncbi:hypothetical protein, partial [Bacillus sp. JJ722]|uniref:hypothetical protein n=1 Tax=Bacillus sp. JJ722 TaxID=3122973 RepID=UPI0030001CA1
MTKWLKAEEVYEIEEIVLKDDEHLDLRELENRGVKITTEQESNFFQKRRDKQEPKKFVEYKPQETETSFQDVDAKVSYQYPKGTFRFPVIPDYLPGERERKKPKVRKQTTPSTQMQSVRERTPEVESLRTNKNIVQKSPIVKEEEPRKRPYVPDEIPSPVYGFQQKPKKEQSDAFEFELTNHDLHTPALYRKEVGKQDQSVQENAIADSNVVEVKKPSMDDDRNKEVKQYTQEMNSTGLQQANDELQEVEQVEFEMIQNEEADMDIEDVQMKEEKPKAIIHEVKSLSEENKEWSEKELENNDVFKSKQVEIESASEDTLLSEESKQSVPDLYIAKETMASAVIEQEPI